MKKEKKKAAKLEIRTDLKKAEQYHFVPELSNVFFPFAPYAQQIDIVRVIQSAIKSKHNALIESPTGTGKTLCLLIGSLSSLIDEDCRKKIYYLTRTHSQISQVINQFKKTVYDCNLNVIASREQFCLNYNITQLKGKQLEKACQELCLQKLCTFKEHSYNKIPKPMELQQFKDFCKKELVCPYFYSKQLIQRCEITILPFNYLLDWNLLEKNSIELKDSVIIFDEAHNIDNLCEQGSDMRLTTDLLFQSIAELRSLIKLQSKKFLHPQFKQPKEDCKEVEEVKDYLESLLRNFKESEEVIFFSRDDFLGKMEVFTETTKNEGLDLGNYTFFCFKARKTIKIFHKKEQSCENLHTAIDIIEKIYQTCSKQDQFKKFSVSLIKGELLFRCLDPSLCFKRLVQCKPRSIILSSGTLGNLEIWEKNLQVTFKEKIATQSFITSHHLYAQVKAKSENSVPFNFSFQGKQTEKQFQQLCKELRKLQEFVTGGIVVAFSNYDLLEKTLKFSSILKKKVYFETKASNIQDIYKQFSHKVDEENTAYLFIIMKGRLSEGINFTGKLCRCLIVVGIPFLPMKNSGISQKMKYLEDNSSRNDADLWYTEQSFRSLNQTIGRAIRNTEDYAAILLFDQRYLKEDNIKNLSKWFTSCLRPSNASYCDIAEFFKNAELPKENHQKKIEKNMTKNKHEPTLCERLLQFSTPSKSIRKKLKLRIESEEPSSHKVTPTVLKEVQVQQEETFKQMNQQLVDFFLNDQDDQETIVKPKESPSKTVEALDETTCQIVGVTMKARNKRRYNHDIDF